MPHRQFRNGIAEPTGSAWPDYPEPRRSLTRISVQYTLSFMSTLACSASTARSLRTGDTTEALYHVTVLSNFLRGYDKYARVYDKARIVESTFPDRFFLLAEHEMGIGIAKASALL